jgi:hypothetical protein
VTLGGVTVTNPNPKQLIEDIRADHPHLIGQSDLTGEGGPGRNPLRRLGRHR